MNTESGSAVAVEGLDPKPVWRIFAEIAAIPRPSKSEGRIREHLREFAKQHGLESRVDGAGNVIVEVPATPGHEAAPVTVLQGHLDMVPEKNSGTAHDFERDPIRLVVDKDAADGRQIVRAEGTTLGADNGVGLAMALAAATERDVVHGPLELLCTVDEEAGMTGAKELTAESFRGRRMLNLDSEEDDAIYIGCAGGMDTSLTWEFQTKPLPSRKSAFRIAVSGLRGGHSGGDIHENRGNAIKLMVRALLGAGLPGMQLATIQAGSKRNAIPREGSVVVCGPKRMLAALRQAAGRVQAEGIAESYEDKLAITVEPLDGGVASAALSAKDTDRFLAAVAGLPHGVMGMHPKVEGLVQTSNNVATVVCERPGGDGKLRVEVGCLSRSSARSLLLAVAAQIGAVGRLAGATVCHSGEYPGWEPNLKSASLATCRRVYETLFGKPPQVRAIHAGLECGIIGERVGDMDMVSFGPTIRGAHCPEEHVYVDSVQKSWKFLRAVLAELAKG